MWTLDSCRLTEQHQNQFTLPIVQHESTFWTGKRCMEHHWPIFVQTLRQQTTVHARARTHTEKTKEKREMTIILWYACQWKNNPNKKLTTEPPHSQWICQLNFNWLLKHFRPWQYWTACFSYRYCTSTYCIKCSIARCWQIKFQKVRSEIKGNDHHPCTYGFMLHYGTRDKCTKQFMNSAETFP